MAQYSDLDSRLLNSGQENEAAGKLREKKTGAAKDGVWGKDAGVFADNLTFFLK